MLDVLHCCIMCIMYNILCIICYVRCIALLYYVYNV